jgi:hypothetical protein
LPSCNHRGVCRVAIAKLFAELQSPRCLSNCIRHCVSDLHSPRRFAISTDLAELQSPRRLPSCNRHAVGRVAFATAFAGKKKGGPPT